MRQNPFTRIKRLKQAIYCIKVVAVPALALPAHRSRLGSTLAAPSERWCSSAVLAVTPRRLFSAGAISEEVKCYYDFITFSKASTLR